MEPRLNKLYWQSTALLTGAYAAGCAIGLALAMALL